MLAKLDRLFRSVSDFTRLLERSKAEGWKVVALDLGVDTSTPVGECVSTVLMAFAQLERRMISQRTRDGLAVAPLATGLIGFKTLGRPRKRAA